MSNPITEKGVYPRTKAIPLSKFERMGSMGLPFPRGHVPSPSKKGEEGDGDLLLKGRPSDGRGEQKRLQDFK